MLRVQWTLWPCCDHRKRCARLPDSSINVCCTSKQSSSPVFRFRDELTLSKVVSAKKSDSCSDFSPLRHARLKKKSDNCWLVPKELGRLPSHSPHITHNNRYLCVADSSFKTHQETEMPHLVCTMHNESSGHDWCLILLISFICSSHLCGAVFQGQWIKHPREAKKCIYYCFRDSDRKLSCSPGQRKRDWAYQAGLLRCRQCHKVTIFMYLLPFLNMY